MNKSIERKSLFVDSERKWIGMIIWVSACKSVSERVSKIITAFQSIMNAKREEIKI